MHTSTGNTTDLQVEARPRTGVKQAITTFYVPIRTFTLWIALAVVALEIARIPLGAGYMVNALIMFLTLALFIYGGARLRHVITAGIRPATHAVGGLLFGIVWSAFTAVANTASTTLAFVRDYWYYSTDAFFVQVPGIRQLIDTNGQPYEVTDAGMTLYFFAINFAIHFSCLAAMTAIGAMLGTMWARWNALVPMAFTVASLFLAYLTSMWMYNNGVRVAAPIPGVFIFMVPLTVVATALAFALSLTSISQPKMRNL